MFNGQIDLAMKLEREGYLSDERVKRAFLRVPREEFVPDSMKQYAYADTPLEIGNGQTISAPHMVMIMCEALDLESGQKVLEIGTGSGYHAAVTAAVIGNRGHVYSVERHPELAETAKRNLKNAGIDNVFITTGDGSAGLPSCRPYDRIYVTCAAPRIPSPLIDQLKSPGMLLVPVGNTFCELTRLTRDKGKISEQKLGGCSFVPLIGDY